MDVEIKIDVIHNDDNWITNDEFDRVFTFLKMLRELEGTFTVKFINDWHV